MLRSEGFRVIFYPSFNVTALAIRKVLSSARVPFSPHLSYINSTVDYMENFPPDV